MKAKTPRILYKIDLIRKNRKKYMVPIEIEIEINSTDPLKKDGVLEIEEVMELIKI